MMNKKSELTTSLKIPLERDVLCVKYSPTKTFFIAGHTDGAVRLYESNTGTLFKTLKREDVTEVEVPVTSIRFRPPTSKVDSSSILTTYTDGKIRLWNYEQGTVIKEIDEKRQTLSSVYHPKLHKFLTVGDNGAINLYDEETMQLEHVYEKGVMSSVVDGHSNRVFAATFHPQQTTEFVTGGWDSVLHFWDMRQSHSIRFVKGVHICGEGLDISRSGRDLLTCSYSRENALQLWHYQTGRLLADVTPDIHKSMLYCGQWLTPDVLVVGGTDPNLLRIVSVRTLNTMLFYKGNTSGVYSVDHCLKGGRTNVKKETTYDFKIVFSIDKSLIETNISI